MRGQTQKFLSRFTFNWLLQHSYKLASKQNRSLLPKLIMIIMILWTHRWNMNWILKYFVEWIWTCCYMLWYELKAILIVCQLHASFYTISIIVWCAHFVTSPITLYLYSTSLLLTTTTMHTVVKILIKNVKELHCCCEDILMWKKCPNDFVIWFE